MQERCFGIIPLKRLKRDWHVLMVQKSEGHWWGLPKGHAEPGESPKDAAERELFEETGLKVAEWIALPPFVERYALTRGNRKVNKTVTYYAARVQGRLDVDSFELIEGSWVPLNQAASLASYPEIKEICRDFLKVFQQIP